MSRITRLSAFAAAAAFLVAAGCQSETTTAADGDGLEGVEKTPDVALLDQAPMRKVVGGDSVSGVRLQCRNWDDSYSIEAGGTELKPDSRGETFLPLPALGDYCEVSIVLTIRTRSTTFRDTLRLDGDCESDRLHRRAGRRRVRALAALHLGRRGSPLLPGRGDRGRAAVRNHPSGARRRSLVARFGRGREGSRFLPSPIMPFEGFQAARAIGGGAL